MLNLHVPFSYDAKVLPSSRHKHHDDVKIREYTDVLLEEITVGDLQLAIVASDGEGDLDDPFRGEPYFSKGDHLFRRARNEITGQPFDARSFEEALSPRYDLHVAWPFEPGEPIPFHRTSLPGPGSRWDHWYWEPLCTWEEDKLAEAQGWKPNRRILGSSRNSMLGLAQEYLSQAIVIVDGEVFVACTEPVWTVREHGDDRGRVFLDRQPIGLSATGSFRLDRLAEAKEWAKRLDGHGVPSGEAEIVLPAAIERDDEWELANLAHSRLHHLPGHPFDPKMGLWAPLRAMAASLKVESIRVTRADAPNLLDAISTIAEDQRLDGSQKLNWCELEMAKIADRWSLAVASSLHPKLSEADLRALRDLDPPAPGDKRSGKGRKRR